MKKLARLVLVPLLCFLPSFLLEARKVTLHNDSRETIWYKFKNPLFKDIIGMLKGPNTIEYSEMLSKIWVLSEAESKNKSDDECAKRAEELNLHKDISGSEAYFTYDGRVLKKTDN